MLQENKENLDAKIRESLGALELNQKQSFGVRIPDYHSVLRHDVSERKQPTYVDFEVLLKKIRDKLFGRK